MAILRIRAADGTVQEVLAIRGESYVLTEADKEEIAKLAAMNGVDLSNYYTKEEVDMAAGEILDAIGELVDLPHLSEDAVQDMIDASISKIAVYNGEVEDV